MSDPLILAPPADAPDRQQPPISPEAAAFWDATRECRLVIQWCDACDRGIHFPRAGCPSCLGSDLSFRPTEGIGTVYALSVMPKPGNAGMAGRAPYVVALVDLPEGVRMLGNVLGDDALEVAVGDEVRVAWEPLPDGRHLPVWVRA